MNYRMIACVTSRILLTEAALMSLSLLTALVYGESVWPFAATMCLLALVGFPFGVRAPKDTALYAREIQSAIDTMSDRAAMPRRTLQFFDFSPCAELHEGGAQ